MSTFFTVIDVTMSTLIIVCSIWIYKDLRINFN